MFQRIGSDALSGELAVHLGLTLYRSLTGFAIAVVLGICGGAGLVYTGIVIARARRQTGYQLVLEDWIWHVALPLIAYASVLAAAFALSRHGLPSQFTIAGAALLLLFIGIHNAWDTVTYITLGHVEPPGPPSGGAG